MAELNAANLAVDAALAATSNLTSRINVVNASITANITAHYENQDLQLSQLNDSCAYCSAVSLGFLEPLVYFILAVYLFNKMRGK